MPKNFDVVSKCGQRQAILRDRRNSRRRLEQAISRFPGWACLFAVADLGSHKGKALRNMIRNAGAHLMFLLPYSPDLNPIEQVFAKIKHLMRRAMVRTVETAQDRLISLLDTIPPSECANYFSGAGYAAT